MKPAAKFLFDDDFGSNPAPKASEPMITLAEHRALLAQAEAQAQARGAAAAAADTARLTALALEAAARNLAALTPKLAAVESQVAADAVGIAYAIARKLAPELVAREPLAEIAALAKECFRHLLSAPHIVVRVNDAIYPAAHETLAEIARSSGFEGRLVVLGESDIAPGDCRIEWADGGICRDEAATQALIAETVGNYIVARRNGAQSSNATGLSS